MKRTLEVSSRGLRISKHEGLLAIRKQGESLASIPFEEIGVVIIDSLAAEITTAATASLLGKGSAVLFCDGKHHPVGLLLPLTGNTLHAERLRQQIALSGPARKNMWRRVVQTKIRNQSRVVSSEIVRRRLGQLAGAVRSGDLSNHEAQAARVYWKAVSREYLDGHFRRDRDGEPPNNLLNYGYAILRAAMARAICGAGLHPALGIQHHSRYDAFSLADDLMEPYRPWVDQKAFALTQQGCIDLDRPARARLLEVLFSRAVVAEQELPLQEAMTRTANSLAVCTASAPRTKISHGSRVSAMSLAKQLLLPSFHKGMRGR